MASIFQYPAALELKFAQVRHLFAGHPGAQPLLGDRALIPFARRSSLHGRGSKEFRQRVGDKARIAAVFQDPHQHVFAFAVRGKAQIFHHQKIFRIGFQQPTALRLAVQPAVSWSRRSFVGLTQQRNRFAGNPFPAAGEAELLGGGRFHVDVVHMAAEILSDKDAHLRNMRQHFQRLGNNR